MGPLQEGFWSAGNMLCKSVLGRRLQYIYSHHKKGDTPIMENERGIVWPTNL